MTLYYEHWHKDILQKFKRNNSLLFSMTDKNVVAPGVARQFANMNIYQVNTVPKLLT